MKRVAIVVWIVLISLVGCSGNSQTETGDTKSAEARAENNSVTPSVGAIAQVSGTPISIREAALATNAAEETLMAPTNVQAAINAERTAIYFENQTLTATLWTVTPTNTATDTPTPTIRPTNTRSATDSDGDGVIDSQDSCKFVFGPASNGGCPMPDADSDGVPDEDDNCPNQSGAASNQGCPIPTNPVNLTLTSTSTEIPPTVIIRNKSTVGAIGQPLTIDAEAVDPTGQGVTRIELKVNDRTVDQKSSPDPNGTTPLVVNLSWTPVRTGNVTIQVVAWRGSVASVPATMALTVGSTLPTGTATTSGSGTILTPVAPTLGPCRARVDMDALNFRSIPDASSPDYIIDLFALNEEPLVLGRLADNSWYQVRDTTSTQIGWVSAGYVTLLGSCASVPVQSPPATALDPEAAAMQKAEQGVSSNGAWVPYIKEFEGVEMVLVPAGCFMMGSSEEQVEAAFAQCEAAFGEGQCSRAWFEAELPAHEICFDEPFWIDRYEVTNAQFAVLNGQAGRASNWTDDDLPRELITWFEARDFCELREARLPTEAEWEYAARGPDARVYPWGDDFDGTRLNFCDTNCIYDWADETVDDGYGNTAPVGSYDTGVSWIGALDMSGNVWEWTSSIYQSYPYQGDDGREDIDNTNNSRVFRGGSWNYLDFNTRAAIRIRDFPSVEYNVVGFRCVRSH